LKIKIPPFEKGGLGGFQGIAIQKGWVCPDT
jgi:hypothetical protein